MKKVKSFIIGIVAGTVIAGTVGALAYTDYIEAVYNDITIMVDGKEVNTRNEPFISEGTTYLPVRDVAEALCKEVSWDGNSNTVYIGKYSDNEATLINDLNNIGDSGYTIRKLDSKVLTDNYGNDYGSGIGCSKNGTFEVLLGKQYSEFEATLYVPEDYRVEKTISLIIVADGKQIYKSPQMSKTSEPIDISLDIEGCNDFKIIFSGSYSQSYNWECQALCLGDAVFYK